MTVGSEDGRKFLNHCFPISKFFSRVLTNGMTQESLPYSNSGLAGGDGNRKGI